MDSKQLTSLFWNEHYTGQDISKLSKTKRSILQWLDRDNFRGFILDNNIFWIEKTYSKAKLPNYIYNYLTKWAEKKGFKALYTI